MATKKYKTIAGYLRSAEERYKIPWDVSDDQRAAAIKAAQRDIINAALSQCGVAPLDADKTPADGIAHRLASFTNNTWKIQIKALKDCELWLKKSFVMWTVTTTGSSSYQVGNVGVASPTTGSGITSSTIYRGYGIKEASGVFAISKDHEVVCTQPSEREALAWIDVRADEALRQRYGRAPGAAS